MGFFKRKKDKKKKEDKKKVGKRPISVDTVDVIEDTMTSQKKDSVEEEDASPEPHFPSDSIPVPPPVMNEKEQSKTPKIAPPKLPDVGGSVQIPDSVREELEKDSPIKQEQSVLQELRGVLSTGGGLQETPKHKRGRKLDPSEIYQNFAQEYQDAAEKHEEAELWQPAAMNYLLSVLSVYMASDAVKATKRLTNLVRTNPILIQSKPVQKGRIFFEAILQGEPTRLDRIIKEMRDLPFQYRDDINLFKKVVRKAKDDVNSL